MNEQLKKEIDEIIANSLTRCENAVLNKRLRLLRKGGEDFNEFLKQRFPEKR